MNWFWFILYFGLIYATGFAVTKCIKPRRNRFWLWMIISWGIWFIVSEVYQYTLLTPGYLRSEVSVFKEDLDLFWLASHFFPVHHGLLVISLIVLPVKWFRRRQKK